MDFSDDNFSLEKAHDAFHYVHDYLHDDYPDSLILGVDMNLFKKINVFPLTKQEKQDVLSVYRELHDLLHYLEDKYG